MKDSIVWGIHAGKTGDAHTLFMKHNVIAIGFVQMNNLSKIAPSREAFKEAALASYPTQKIGAIPNIAGQTYRFVHEMKQNDYVVYSSKHDRKVHIGKVEGDYCYDVKTEKAYPNVRSVKWLVELPRTAFTQGALYEIGSAMSLFQIKNYTEEFLSAIDGKKIKPAVPEDETVADVAQNVETSTEDFILKRLSQELKGHPFAHFIGHLLQVMGYQTRISPEGPDGGVDILAHKDELGFEPPIIKVQVKSNDGSIGDHEVSALYGKVSQNEFGLFVALGSFTSKAKAFAKSKSNLRLIDGAELIELIFRHYEQFDSRYKGLIPLKRVFVPAPIEESEE
jgi:restriction system protein